MTGLRCPNCGFYNLSARSKCARCGKPLPEIGAEPKPADLFEPEKAEATGSESLPKKDPAAAAEPTTTVTTPQPAAPEPPAQAEAGIFTGSGSFPKKEAAPKEMPPEMEAEIFFTEETPKEPPAASASGSMPKMKPIGANESGSIITAEIVNETTAARTGNDNTPTEYDPASQPPAELPDEKPASIIPEVPSFDDSAASKIGTEAELGELSEFFKDAKRKPPAPERVKPAPKPAPKTVSRPTPPPRQERLVPPPPPEPEEISVSKLKPEPLDESSGLKAEADPVTEPSKIKLQEEPAGAEDSISRIKIQKGADASQSDFNANFAEPVLDFGTGSDSQQSESDSAVSRPFEAGSGKIILAGVVDLAVYFVIAGVTVMAGSWASGQGAGLGVTSAASVPVGIAILFVLWFYQVFFLSVLGQTPGQMAAGIEVLDKSGRRPSVPQASVRASVHLLCLIPFGLGFVPTLLGSSLPDKFAQTKIVKW